MPLDRPKFVKVLQMTQSKNDAEALSAIRLANKMLTDAGVGWSGLISGSRAPVKQGAPPPWVRPAPRITITEAFDQLEQAGELIDDFRIMHDTWHRRKSLSPHDQRLLFDKIHRMESEERRRTSGPEWEPE